MKTCLVSITPDAESTIMFCARVSNPKNQTSGNTGLLNFCIRNGHWSVFEMANMVIEIQTSRAISAQILRHRSFSFQEFSQRYAPVQGFEPVNARRRGTTNRQSSTDDLEPEVQQAFQDKLRIMGDFGMKFYHELIDAGVANESARFLLPLNAETTLYMNGTIRSWIHYLDTRCKEDTQQEHREIALAIRDIFITELPVIAAAKGWVEVDGEG
jgi:thymidylate synthase (FAD)